MNKKRWIWRLIWLGLGMGVLAALAVLFEEARGRALVEGARRIRRGETDAVSLSSRVTRILTRGDQRAEAGFRDMMKQKGWDFVCYYGRSALYRHGDQEVLARKKALPGGLSLYELLDENYLKYMKSDIREVA